MASLYLWLFGPLVAGVVLASVWWLVAGRASALPRGPVSAFTLAAGLLVLLGEVATRLLDVSPLMPFDVPRPVSEWYMDFRFAIPVLLGAVAVALLALPVRARQGRGVAELTRRSLVSFARPWWFVAPGMLLALVLLVTVVAGAASEPDPVTGRSTAYTVGIGREYSMGTSIYGWFYSVPSLVCLGALLVVAVVGMSRVARPPISDEREEDIRARSLRTGSIVGATTGVLLLHLGDIFSSLAGTASIRATVTTSEGPVSFWTTFSALQPAFVVASMLCAALGAALWAGVALLVVRSGDRARVAVRS